MKKTVLMVVSLLWRGLDIKAFTQDDGSYRPGRLLLTSSVNPQNLHSLQKICIFNLCFTMRMQESEICSKKSHGYSHHFWATFYASSYLICCPGLAHWTIWYPNQSRHFLYFQVIQNMRGANCSHTNGTMPLSKNGSTVLNNIMGSISLNWTIPLRKVVVSYIKNPID